MNPFLRSLGLAALVLLGSTSVLTAQEGDSAGPGSTASSQDDDDSLPKPSSLEEAGSVDLDTFKDLSEVSTAELQGALGAWQSVTQSAVDAFDAAKGGEKDIARSAVDRALGVLDKLIVALDARDDGGSTEAAAAVRTRVKDALKAAEEQQADLTTAEALAVNLKVLEAQMRPLELAEIEERLAVWQGIVREKAEVVRNLEVAKIRSGEGAGGDSSQQTADALDRSNELKKLKERFLVVIEAYEAKGGDAAGWRAYAESVQAPPDLSGVGAVFDYIQAWVLDEEGGIAFAIDIVTFLAIIFIFRFLAGIIARIADRAMKSMKNSPALLRNFVVNTSRKLVNFIGLIVALGEIGVDIGPFVAAIGAVGFVIGFALQGTLSNFAAGVMVMLYRPFDLGDVVSAAGVTGKVDGMTLVSTTIKTFDNQTIVVPNGMVWGDVITNITANNTRRVDLTYGIGYGDDIEKALKVLTEIVENHPLVLKDPAVTIKLHELADSSVNFIVRPWCKTADYWDVHWDITRQVKEKFDANNISIPFPQQDVHMHQVTDASA